MWGCSAVAEHLFPVALVFPTYVGMFRGPSGSRRRAWGFPHVCGDVPPELAPGAAEPPFSPRMWGCSGVKHGETAPGAVFPTYVGMFRRSPTSTSGARSFPHVCGDVPSEYGRYYDTAQFSPRMWGCSLRQRGCGGAIRVFPTYVGMFLSTLSGYRSPVRFPHVCGDVPLVADQQSVYQ